MGLQVVDYISIVERPGLIPIYNSTLFMYK